MDGTDILLTKRKCGAFAAALGANLKSPEDERVVAFCLLEQALILLRKTVGIETTAAVLYRAGDMAVSDAMSPARHQACFRKRTDGIT